jgi:hypothetical protein
MEQYVNRLLSTLDKQYDEVAKKKHGKSPEISWGALLEGLLHFNSLKETRQHLGLAEQTLNRLLHRSFPGANLQGGGETWHFYLLTLIDCYYCNKCSVIVSSNAYCSYASTCKACRKVFNTTEAKRRSNRIAQRTYYNSNPKYFTAKNAKYRAAKLKRTVVWGQEGIEAFYARCPPGYHVDHIVPIQGKNVSGLHVLNNLQYLIAVDNLRKSNHYDSEYK